MKIILKRTLYQHQTVQLELQHIWCASMNMPLSKWKRIMTVTQNEVVADPKSSSEHVHERVDIGEHESMSATTAESKDSDFENII